MEILTREGYKHIDNIQIGDEIVGKDGVINTLIDKRIFDKTWFEEQEISQDWKWYLINGTYRFFHHQNIFVSRGYYNLCHVFELEVGWYILDENGVEIEIVSIEETSEESNWHKLDISGDHSFVTQGLQVHNASRYWVGGGSSVNWNATGNTNWSATSGGSNNASVPGAADDVTFDGVGTNGNTNSTISVTVTILSFTSSSGYTATITRNATLTVVNNFTLHKNTVWAGASGLTISGTSTITANGFSAGDTFWSNDLQFSGNAVKTLVSSTGDIKIGGTFSTPAITGTNTVNSTGVTFTISGLTASSTSLTGTAKIVLIGGTWSGLGTVQNNLDLQGNVTVSGTVQYMNGTLKYVSGTITTTSSTLQLNASTGSSVTLDCGGMTWVNLSFNNINTGTTLTLSSNLNLSGNLLAASQTLATIVINGLFNLSVGGNFSPTLTTGSFSGTSTIVMNGTGTLATNSATSGFINNNLTINTTGTITLGTTLAYRTGTLTHTAGTVTSTGNTLNIGAATTINVNSTGFSLNNVITTANTTFGGTNGFTIGGTYTCTTAGITHTFASTKTYAITTLLLIGTGASRNTLRSSSAGSRANINLTNQSADYNLDVTDIDGSGGAAGYTFGTVSNSLNWNGSTVLYWVSSGSSWTSNTNWSPASGGPAINVANFAPAATDAIAFDVNSGNSSISGATRSCGSVTFAGYASTITLSAGFGLNVGGNITLGPSTMTVSGTGFLAFNNVSATFDAGGYVWPNEFRFITITTSKTYTIASDCTFGGVVTNTGSVGGALANIFAGGRTITCNAGINNTVSTYMQGVTSYTTFIIAGGTLNGTFTQFTNVTLNSASIITVNAVGMYSVAGAGVNPPTFTYTAGTITGTRTLSFGSCTLNLGSNVKWTAASSTVAGLQGTTVLTNDLYCEGTYTHGSLQFSSSTAYSLYAWSYAGSSVSGGPQGSTAPKIVMNGTGSITFTGSNDWMIEINTTGTVTSAGTLTLGGAFSSAKFNWVQGDFIHSGTLSVISGGSATFNTGPISWYNVTLGASGIGWGTALVLLSDFIIRGQLTFTGNQNILVSGPGIMYADGNLTFAAQGYVSSAGTKIVLTGTGSWVHSNSVNITGQIDINTGGTITFGSASTNSMTIYKSGSFNYVKGRLITKGASLSVATTSSGWINMHRVPFDSVTITGGTTQTMNEFFGGRPGKYCTVSSTTTTNVTINFTDTFEKFSRWVLPSNITISQRGQVKLLSSKGNRNSTNLGFTYFEGVQPYGVPHNNPIVYQGSQCFGIGDSPADPNFF